MYIRDSQDRTYADHERREFEVYNRNGFRIDRIVCDMHEARLHTETQGYMFSSESQLDDLRAMHAARMRAMIARQGPSLRVV